MAIADPRTLLLIRSSSDYKEARSRSVGSWRAIRETSRRVSVSVNRMSCAKEKGEFISGTQRLFCKNKLCFAEINLISHTEKEHYDCDFFSVWPTHKSGCVMQIR